MIPRDKLFHIALGVLAIVCALAALMIHAFFGLGPTLAYTTTAVGVFYEAQQWWRREGSVEWQDAVATALPGFVAWGLLEMMERMA